MGTLTADDRRRLRDALGRAEGELLASRCPQGGWRGRLSASALSTATACVALGEVARQLASRGEAPPVWLGELADRGCRWLVDHANPDGGWGDTVRSDANLSTTALCWAALDGREAFAPAVAAARSWIVDRTGSLEPGALKRAIEASYGADRTFSIPILTHCAIAGVLGPREEAFAGVTRLPFELAAFPQSWFRFLGLPVVSYALPALIAVGQAQHRYRRPGWPLAALRDALRRPTQRRLQAIQPSSGGFLEAVPLTSFVTMSLAAAGLPDHAVVGEGLRFLRGSVRADGSWPIDVDLATWLTTLSVLALSAGDRPSPLAASERAALRDRLLGQQARTRHPYTGAAPGGWAWTDLPGGVPDADDTCGALLALTVLDDGNTAVADAAEAGLGWLLGLANRDGGIPTFCRGWGKLPFDRSAPDLTAHALRAFAAWQPRVAMPLGGRLARARRRLLAYLGSAQRGDGAWAPLWFGNQHARGFLNLTYGTARTLRALDEAGGVAGASMGERAERWLRQAQGEGGGWGGDRGVEPSLEETALAVEALAGRTSREARHAAARGARWLADRIADGGLGRAAPIGFYFANLWYFEDLYPKIFAVAALRRALASA